MFIKTHNNKFYSNPFGGSGENGQTDGFHDANMGVWR